MIGLILGIYLAAYWTFYMAFNILYLNINCLKINICEERFIFKQYNNVIIT